MRAFIAIELPKEVKEGLTKLQDELKKSRANVKWVEPENIHLNLKFLGEISQEQLEKISAIIKNTAENFCPFYLRVSCLGAFPKIDLPRVIWAGLDQGSAETQNLAKSLEEKIAGIGIAKENRPFSAHITIGRVRPGESQLALIKSLKNLSENFSWGTKDYLVGKITLFKSTLTPKGPVYTPLIESSLNKT